MRAYTVQKVPIQKSILPMETSVELDIFVLPKSSQSSSPTIATTRGRMMVAFIPEAYHLNTRTP